MLIKHKFLNILESYENEPLTGLYSILIIGTFNPEPTEKFKNDALFFYGRRRNRLWYLLPKMLGKESLHWKENPGKSAEELAVLWKTFTKDNSVVIVDLIKAVEMNELKDFKDETLAGKESKLIGFDFRKAFADTKFDCVIYTRSTWNGIGKIKELKDKADVFWKERNIPVCEMLTPARGTKGMTIEGKLEWWKENYRKAIHI